EAALLAREAALAPDETARIRKEAVLARHLLLHRRKDDARKVWAKLKPRIEALPEGASKIAALVDEASFLETAGGDAAGAWAALSTRYPFSLGVLEDRLAFLKRVGQDAEGLELLEKAASRAAEGHRLPLTERLVKDSLDAGDLPRGRRALAALLALKL